MATEETKVCLDRLTLRELDKYDFDGTRDRIVDLAGRGYTATYISRALGLSSSTVTRLLKSEFAERNANRQQILEAHAQTVQWLKMKCTDAIANPPLDKNGNVKDWDRKAAELLLRILEREAKLFGLDQPTQLQVQVEELSDDDLQVQLAAAGYHIQVQSAPKSLPEPVDDAEYEDTDAGSTEDRQDAGEATASEDQ